MSRSAPGDESSSKSTTLSVASESSDEAEASSVDASVVTSESVVPVWPCAPPAERSPPNAGNDSSISVQDVW